MTTAVSYAQTLRWSRNRPCYLCAARRRPDDLPAVPDRRSGDSGAL